MSERASYILLFVLILVVIATGASAQHSPLYSQYMFNGLVINPAYAGSRDGLSVTALHRDQWTGIEGAPSTQTVSAHALLKNSKVGLGLVLYADQIGVTAQKGVACNYAYRLRAGNGHLAFGLSAGASVVRSAWTSLSLTETGDAVFQQDTRGSWVPNAGAGFYYHTERMYAGLSVPAMLTNIIDASGKNVIDRDPRSYNVMATSGVLFALEDIKIKPSLLLKYLHASPFQYDINTSIYIRDMIEIGASYRSGDAVTGLVAYNISKQLRAGYAYDHTLSPMRSYSKSSHEFMLQYELRYKLKAMNPRYF